MPKNMFDDEPGRFNLLPYRHFDVMEFVTQAQDSTWFVHEIGSLVKDLQDFEQMSCEERHFVAHVLAFFNIADGIVNQNLVMNIYPKINFPEVLLFYNQQIFIEGIHQQVYSLLLSSYVTDAVQAEFLVNAMQTIPAVHNKADWALTYMESDSASFAQKLVAFACFEGIMFSGSFCAIFWLKRRGLVPGLSIANEFISKDEGLHCQFACFLYQHYQTERLSDRQVLDIVTSCVETEYEFILSALPCSLIGMNADQMKQYIQFVADKVLIMLGVAPHYCAKNPFPWMVYLNLQVKTNFFDEKVASYQQPEMVEVSQAALAGDADF